MYLFLFIGACFLAIFLIGFITSIISLSILHQKGFIDDGLIPIIIAVSIIFKFVVPPLFANLIMRWEILKLSER